MILKELLKKLKAFDCAALNGGKVSHYFVTKDACGHHCMMMLTLFAGQ